MEIYPLLKMPPFQGTTEDELLPLILAPEHACRLYKPSDFIAMQGEVYRSLFILCSGKVRTQMVNAEGKQLTIETLKAPQLLAPAFVFSSENRFPVNIEAIEECEILVVNKKRLSGLPAPISRSDAQLFKAGIGQNPVPFQKAECLRPAEPQIASAELSAHARLHTQPAGSGTDTRRSTSFTGTGSVRACRRRVYPHGRKRDTNY